MADTLILKLKAEGTKYWRRTFFNQFRASCLDGSNRNGNHFLPT